MVTGFPVEIFKVPESRSKKLEAAEKLLVLISSVFVIEVPRFTLILLNVETHFYYKLN